MARCLVQELDRHGRAGRHGGGERRCAVRCGGDSRARSGVRQEL
jgi:hypothetical protein